MKKTTFTLDTFFNKKKHVYINEQIFNMINVLNVNWRQYKNYLFLLAPFYFKTVTNIEKKI